MRGLVVAAVAAVLLLPAVAVGQISMESRYDPHVPILIGCGCVVPDGWNLNVRWRIRGPGVETIPVGDGLHAWAKPGRYTVEMRARMMLWAPVVDRDGNEISAIIGWDEVDDEREFIVGDPPPPPSPDDPEPGPGPGPSPTDFQGKVKAALEELTGHRDAASQVANNYEAVAARAAGTPSQWDPALMLAEVRVEHASTMTAEQIRAWQPAFAAIHRAMAEEQMGSTDLQAHIEIFHAIASALR